MRQIYLERTLLLSALFQISFGKGGKDFTWNGPKWAVRRSQGGKQKDVIETLAFI